MPTTTAPTVADVERIVALDDQPVLRNLLITQAYHDLSHAMGQLLGADNANWCTFGCWASRTAGRFIRREEVPGAFRAALEQDATWQDHADVIEESLGHVHEDVRPHNVIQHLEGAVGGIVDDVALYITEGNRVVFADLGRLFADFIATFAGDAQPDHAKLQKFVEAYEVGEVLPDEVTIDHEAKTIHGVRRGGESLLREMIRIYHQALYEVDAQRKAQLILFANALGGLHEQTRLQTYIVGSLDAPIHDMLHTKSHGAIRDRVHDTETRSRAHAVLDVLIRPLTDELTRVWQTVSTKAMMVLKLPDGVLWLGRDIPAVHGMPLFPPHLETIVLPELKTVLERYGALVPRDSAEGARPSWWHSLMRRIGVIGPDLVGSAATDWSRLTDRMHFIFELFRSRQQDADLLGTPFTAEQTAAIRDGRVPEGPLY